MHSKPFKQQPAFKARLIREWAVKTDQKWPTYEKINPITGKKQLQDYQAHHIIPQQVGGPHEWWNIHPMRDASTHQGGIHGSGSELSRVLRTIPKPQE